MNRVKKVALDFVWCCILICIVIGTYWMGYNFGWNAHVQDVERRFKEESAMIDVSINAQTVTVILAGKVVASYNFASEDVLAICWSVKPETWPCQIGADSVALINPTDKTDPGLAVIELRVPADFAEAARLAFRNKPAQGTIHR